MVRSRVWVLGLGSVLRLKFRLILAKAVVTFIEVYIDPTIVELGLGLGISVIVFRIVN